MKQGTVTYCILLIFFLSSGVCHAQVAIFGCERTAYMGKCENLALPDDYEETNTKYLDCLGEQMNFAENGAVFITPTTDDKTVANWEQALENCKNLKPDYGRSFSTATSEAMLSLCQSWIASILTCDRFHMVNHALVQAYRERMELSGMPVKEDKSTIPEYFFEATYDCARDPVIREREIQNGDTIEEELYPSYLNLRLYFDGNQKELVKEWTVNSPIHTFHGLTNRMFKNRTSLLRTEVPITNLLDEFEKKPVMCNVITNKHSLEKGEEVDITISNFRDSKGRSSREFNRIIVHASEGDILNGEKSALGSQYSVFRLNELPVKVKYKAPEHSEARSDRITVYNSCDILPVEKVQLRNTKLGDQICTHNLLITHYDWTGTINLEITQTFTCDVEEPTSDLSTKRILAGDHRTTYTNISIGLSDFNLPASGTSAGAKIQYISGQLTVNMREEHTVEGSAQKTQCHNNGTGKWEWVAPGNWSTRHETMAGQAYADIGEGGITLLIAKEMLGDKKAADNMQQQMAEMQAKMQQAMQSMDKQAMEKIKVEMRNMMQGDQEDASIPIKAVINISMGAGDYPVYTSSESKTYNVCTGEYEKNESGSETIEMPLLLPIGAEMKGEYTRGRNGNDHIVATINETKPFSPTFGSGSSCPEGTITVNGTITLERHKE